MKKKLLLICSLSCLIFFAGCKKDDSSISEELKPKTLRTVLMYLFHDTNLWEPLTGNINEIEKGWDPGINGTMLVFVDASSNFTQFGGNPVLLEISHDTTNLIVSKVVKTYEDADATDPARFKLVQEDAMKLYPADSYGLIISGHGNGFFVAPDDSKGLAGSDRWSSNYLEVDQIAKNAATHYDFIVFDACLMAESTTLYQLRNITDYVVASVELTPGDGFAYGAPLASLFTQPKADLYHFVEGTTDYYYYTERGKQSIEGAYQTIGVYNMSKMEQFAAMTKKVVEKLNLTYPELKSEIFTKIIGQPGLESSMYYPQLEEYGPVSYYDMALLGVLLNQAGESAMKREYYQSLEKVVTYPTGAFSDSFLILNSEYPELSSGLSFYIPSINPLFEAQDVAFYNRFEWSTASGFTKKRE